jgi:hypothetical protein
LVQSHKVSDGLDSILPDAASEELRKWWNRIIEDAKVKCNDPQGKLINSELLLGQEHEIKADDAEKARDCVRKAIEQHHKSMPNISGEVFMQIIKNFASKK